ncbi:Transposon TX1 uncharacterized 149 kDa protein [Vitis vinifera]|uniref:Transposon TX1 uncharacterized 149 kDa protein n=1 Tax=Vitis vinifera TaxID=29760 RepID=A0A438G178_VITVI|nr:Transposon TX1 uncharacterized 149 kDa protein [Vitis vinifera]
MEEEEARKEARELYKKLEVGDVERLEKPFSEEEVFEALEDCCGEKTPGPDDFSMAFWQFAWDFVKEEVMNLFRQFHETGRFVRSLNATFLVLIPKKGGVEDLKDFKPISLVGGLYKCLAKVLANRLKGVLAKVISLSQNAFVEGRQIMDAILIANEAIDSILKSNNGAILCKLDIEKAYDHMDWSFLLAVLGKMDLEEGLKGLKARRPPFALSIQLADEYGYKVGNLPSTCLGMPLGAPFKSIGVWDGIEERFRKRLAMWKRQYISKGGRITLIRSTLSNLSIYFMSIFHLPMAVRMKLEKIQRDFLWGGGSLEQKPHLVRWPIVCEDKSKGGLGVKSLGLFNKAFLGKWSWRFANEKKSPLESDDQKEVRGGNWRMEIFLDSEGDRRGSWTPTFNRPFNDWEMEEVGRLLCYLEGKMVRVDEEDRAGELQAQFKLQISPEEYAQDNLKFGLVEVVYEWAKELHLQISVSSQMFLKDDSEDHCQAG